MNYIVNFFTTTFNVICTLPLMESFILVDSLVSAGHFLKDYLLLKMITIKSSKVLMDHRRDIIKNYTKIYTLNVVDRYLVYLGFHALLSWFNHKFVNLLFLTISLPFVQNWIVTQLPLEYYLENKSIFIRYSVSKLIVNLFSSLHQDIQPISNYNIFMIYNFVSTDYLYTFVKNYLFISLLYFLKSKESLYVYYKAVKVAYMYHTGYNFVNISLYDSVFLANLIVKEKRWNELTKMEVVNMFYVLINNKLNDPYSNWRTNITLFVLEAMSIWSIISCIKLFWKMIPFEVFPILVIFFFKMKNRIRKFMTCVIVSLLLNINVNDLFITGIVVGHDLVYYILGEIYFFMRNVKSIRKLIYKPKPKIESKFEIQD